MEEYSLKEIIESNHEVVIESLRELKEKVDKTNGRVKALEIWRSFIVGGLTMLVVLIGWFIEVHK